MRIGINTLFEHPEKGTGGLTYLTNLVRELAEVDRANEYIVYVSPRNKILFRWPEAKNFSYHLCPASNEHRLMRLFSEHLLLPRFARHDRLDVFHFPGNVIPRGIPCRAVVTIHSLHHYLTPTQMPPTSCVYRRLMTRHTLQYASNIIAPSHYVKQRLIELFGVPLKKISVVWDGVATETFTSTAATKRSNILFVSQLHPYKNVPALLEAFKTLREQKNISDCDLLIVGGGAPAFRKRLEKKARLMGLENRVKFLGRVMEVQSWYQKALVFVYPSLQEEFGLPVLEAMASGVPVVASDRGSVPEIAGDAALLVDPHDTEGMAEAICSLIRNRELWQRMASRGLERVKEFSWRRTAEETVRVYERAYRESGKRYAST